MVEPTHLENMSQIGMISPGRGQNKKNMWVATNQFPTDPQTNMVLKISIRTPTRLQDADKLQDADAQEMQWQTSNKNFAVFFLSI